VNDGNGATSKLVGTSVKTFSLSGLKSGTVEAPWKSHHAAVLIFFASFCGPCKSEMPKVAKYLRHHNEGSIRVIGIDALDSRGPAEAFVKKSGVTFPIAFDPNGTVTNGHLPIRLRSRDRVRERQGILKQVYYGAIPKDVLVRGIAALRTT